MSRYSELIKELDKFCDSMQCDLTIKHYSRYEVCFKAVPTDADSEYADNPFTVSIGYRRKRTYNKDENGNRIVVDTVDTKRTATFDICSNNDEYSGGQFTRKQIELLLSLDDLTDEELCIDTPKEQDND